MKNERLDLIIEMLQRDRMVKSLELSERFHVSMETIRRDLEILEKKGIVTRVYGGASLKSMYGVEPEYAGRGVKNYEQKQRIAHRAAELVAPGDTILIDVGTTTLEFARCLAGIPELQVFTNSIPVAMELMQNGNARVCMIGGELRSGELSSSGPAAEQMIRNYYVDKLFIGIGGISPEHGVCDYHIGEASLRRLYLRQATKVIGLADSSKFGVTAMNRICGAEDLDVLVTDPGADPQMVAELEKMGVQVIIAG